MMRDHNLEILKTEIQAVLVEEFFPYHLYMNSKNVGEPPANGRKDASKIIQGEEGEIRV
ncbi:MAG: hypothetical protein ACW96X_10340 [Promethearchaeota archaeon]|jgi:hypothetical protein